MGDLRLDHGAGGCTVRTSRDILFRAGNYSAFTTSVGNAPASVFGRLIHMPIFLVIVFHANEFDLPPF